jgi:AcrR family transcriptional regulator
MSKGFSDNERELIKLKLQESCEECWGKHGYKKTNVSELCQMSGISTGAFYLFYESKEMLFIDTFNNIQVRFNSMLERIMPENPTKYDYANVLKQIFHELEKTPWVLKLQGDLNIILRKLPPEFLKDSYKNDITDFINVIVRYNLKPNVSVDILTSISYILVFSITMLPVAGDYYIDALDLIIDSVIEKYFD